MKLSRGERAREVRLEGKSAVLDGERVEFELGSDGAAGDLIVLADGRHRVRAARRGDAVFVWCDGEVYEFHRARPAARAAGEHGNLLAPMPGRIRQMLVSTGQRVERGQILMILEAMKMEHAIRSPRDGTVVSLPHGEGELVEAGVPLAEITGDAGVRRPVELEPVSPGD